MSQLVRSSLALLLAVILAVTSVSAAFARGQADPAGTMVLCRGLVTVTVVVDANGQPIGIPHLCPDAAVGFFVDSGESAPAESRVFAWQTINWAMATIRLPLARTDVPRARGPPSLL